MTTTTTTTTMKSLPEEVVIEILLRFPAKDQIRSRCVCKAWLKLLTTDPHFYRLHLHHLTNKHPNPHQGILVMHLQNNSLYIADTDDGSPMEIQCPFSISFPKQHAIYGICNGLLCFASSNNEEKSQNVYVWNPLLREHITIPCSPIPSHLPIRTLSTTYGFGFCEFTKEFKVLRFLSSNFGEFQSDVSVYTLGKHSWRTLGSIGYDVNILEESTALVKNALHWFAARPGSVVWNVIVSFNMKEESFQEVPQPDGISYNYPNHVTIGELGGKLCIYCAVSKEDVQIWVMKEYGVADSWMKWFKIGRPEVTGSFYLMQPLAIADSGEIIIMKNDGKIILYNPRTNSTRKLKKFGFEFHDAYPYVGSIISPRLVNGGNTSPM